MVPGYALGGTYTVITTPDGVNWARHAGLNDLIPSSQQGCAGHMPKALFAANPAIKAKECGIAGRGEIVSQIIRPSLIQLICTDS